MDTSKNGSKKQTFQNMIMNFNIKTIWGNRETMEAEMEGI